jgi:hypothetical protein
MSTSIRHTPSNTHLYGLYDPEGDGITFYESAKERDEAAEKTIQAYLDDNVWFEEVTSVFAFMVTHRATEIDVVRPVGEIDEDGYDEVGEYWPDTDCQSKCNYALKTFPEIES